MTTDKQKIKKIMEILANTNPRGPDQRLAKSKTSEKTEGSNVKKKRKPTAYNMFVKNNYEKAKKKAGSDRKKIMSELGKMWKDKQGK